VHSDAFAWLGDNPAAAGSSVITSLPDVSEIPGSFEGWKAWFFETAGRVIRWVPDEGVAIFFQSDIRHGGVWIDKGYLVTRAAEEQRATLLWHKIVCREPPGSIGHGRSSYSHMICVARGPCEGPRRSRPGPRRPTADVLASAGFMSWSKGMGIAACHVACRYLLDETVTRVVVDPFCGRGSVLGVANALGLDAIGIDVSARSCRAARKLVVDSETLGVV
jgi:hypothetical protein